MVRLTVILTENVPRSLRGELTRWMLELKPGAFVGALSRRVREKLWQKAQDVCLKKKEGGCILIQAKACEQRFEVQVGGETQRTIENLDGLLLPRVPARSSTVTPYRTKWAKSGEIPTTPPVDDQPPQRPVSRRSTAEPLATPRVSANGPRVHASPDSAALSKSVGSPSSNENLSWFSEKEVRGMVPRQFYSRGDAYQRLGAIQNARVDPESKLLYGQAHGTDVYEVTVTIRNGRLHGECTCPVRGPCKHCVALCLEFLRNSRAFKP